MVFTFSWRGLLKHGKFYLKIVLLAVIVFYIIPKLLTLFWDVYRPTPKNRDEHLLEKPLRVECVITTRTV